MSEDRKRRMVKKIKSRKRKCVNEENKEKGSPDEDEEREIKISNIR